MSAVQFTVFGTPGPQGLEHDQTNGRFLPKHGGFGTPEYDVWRSMIKRCTLPSNPSYKRYGGRGITVCERWLVSFKNFISDMGLRPSPAYSIDRENNNLGYSPDNCRWTTLGIQQSNRECVVRLTMGDITMPLSHWAKQTGISRSTLRQRLNSGWSHEKALTTPPDKRRASR